MAFMAVLLDGGRRPLPPPPSPTHDVCRGSGREAGVLGTAVPRPEERSMSNSEGSGDPAEANRSDAQHRAKTNQRASDVPSEADRTRPEEARGIDEAQPPREATPAKVGRK